MFQETFGRVEYFELCRMPTLPLDYTGIVFRHRERVRNHPGKKDKMRYTSTAEDL